VSGDAVHQPTWPLLLKIEPMVKLQVLVNNINFEVNLITHLGVIALFSIKFVKF
jgi:hypothetical protein